MANIGYIQVTRACNQKCVICSNPPTGISLSFEQAKKKVDELKRKRYAAVILTGGEPTLYVQLPELIKYCIRKEILPRIITNAQRIANMKYLRILTNAGLQHLNVSVYSSREHIHNTIADNENSFKNFKRAMDNLKKMGNITVDVTIAISKNNANHLFETVSWLIKQYYFIKTYVFNNLDPAMNRTTENFHIIPRLNDFELELHRALEHLEKNKKNFRVEKVPLCYLTDFEQVSTETRKIVKNEDRVVYFLDKRAERFQGSWYHKKAGCCQCCSLNEICAGLYCMGKYYEEKELYPVFIDPQKVTNKIFS